MREEHKLQVFGNIVLRKISGAEKGEVGNLGYSPSSAEVKN
jgi:hypothetical protein